MGLSLVLLLGACAAPDTVSFHDRLYTFANAGWIRVGDLTGGKLDSTSVYGTRECSVLLDPNARMANGDYKVRMTLCRKPSDSSVQVATR